MDSSKKSPSFFLKRGGPHIFILLAIGLLGVFPLFDYTEKAKADSQLSLAESISLPQNSIIQGDSILESKNPLKLEDEIAQMKKIEVVVTGYSSSPLETDDTPYITAFGTQVREGIVATNVLPFGTKIRLPEIYGDRIFIVEDRMCSDRSYNVDIWFPSSQDALNFGVKRTYVEIL
jgi:3D (Asp-Asp-Asp) domain-containing protein